MTDYLTIVYRITHPGQPKALLDQAEWSAASHTHAIRERDHLQSQRDELLHARQVLGAENIALKAQRDDLLAALQACDEAVRSIVESEIIRDLKAQLGRANALCRIRLDRIRELEEKTITETDPGSAYQRGYMDGMAKGRRDAAIDALEQPVEQEPVAWIEVKPNMFDTSCRGVASVLDHKLPPGDHHLYTHSQPQRGPLSDKALNLIASGWHLHLLEGEDKKDVFEFARAIERAHGIGG